MSLSITVRAMVGAGCTPEQILAVIEANEAIIEIAVADRRAKDAERQRRKRSITQSHAESRGQAVTLRTPPSPFPEESSFPPDPLSETQTYPSSPSPPIVPPPLRNAFSTFWAAYPHKVGKRAAEACFLRALKRAGSLEAMMEGLDRATKSRNWQDGIIPNPTTWLNQDRWLDEPSVVVSMRSGTDPPGRSPNWRELEAKAAENAMAGNLLALRMTHDPRRTPKEPDSFELGEPLLALPPPDAEPGATGDVVTGLARRLGGMVG